MAPPPSIRDPFCPTLILDRIEQQETQFILSVHARQVPCCPRCGRSSRSQHSHYTRTIQDLPWQGRSVGIRLKVRRFRCRNAGCDQKIFAERLPATLQPYARRSDRLETVIRLVGYNLGGLPGSRILDRLAVQVSDDTVLRTVKRPNPACGEAEPLRHLGVDDWAWKKGQNYGTILVDLERHKVADLLPERSAESFEQWLHRHPSVETVNRDRCGYTRKEHPGAPRTRCKSRTAFISCRTCPPPSKGPWRSTEISFQNGAPVRFRVSRMGQCEYRVTEFFGTRDAIPADLHDGCLSVAQLFLQKLRTHR